MKGTKCAFGWLLLFVALLAGAFYDAGKQENFLLATSKPFKGVTAWIRHMLYHPWISIPPSPDWRFLPAVIGSEIWLLRISDGTLVRRLKGGQDPLALRTSDFKYLVRFSPDGQLLGVVTIIKYTGDKSYTNHFFASVWRIKDGKQLYQFNRYVPITVVWNADACLLSDGTLYIACAFYEGKKAKTALWRIRKGKWDLVKTWQVGANLAFSPNGKWLAISLDHTTQLWRLTPSTPRLVHKLPNMGKVLNFSHNSQFLAISIKIPDEPRRVSVYQIADGQLVGRFKVVEKEREIAYSLSVAPNGRLIAILSSHSSIDYLRIWQVRDGKQVCSLEWKEESITEVIGFSPDGRQVAFIAPSGLYFWNIANGQLKRVSDFEGGFLTDIVFAPKPLPFVATTGDPYIRIWEVSTGRLVKILKATPYESDAWRIAFSPDGRFLASGAAGDCGDDTISVWQVEGWRELWRKLNHHGASSAISVAFSPDSELLASCGWDGTIRFWRTKDGQPLNVIKGQVIERKKVMFDNQEREVEWRERFHTLAFLADGKTLITGGSLGIAFWDVPTGQLLKRWTKEQEVWSIALSPDGQWLAIGTKHGYIALYRLIDGECLWRYKIASHEIRVAVAMSPDGQFLACSNGEVRRVADGMVVQRLPNLLGHIFQIAFSPDGKWLGIACRYGLLMWQ